MRLQFKTSADVDRITKVLGRGENAGLRLERNGSNINLVVEADGNDYGVELSTGIEDLSLGSIYSDDATIGPGRIAGITDTLQFGTTVFVNESTGRVGIGAAATARTLEVAGQAAILTASVPVLFISAETSGATDNLRTVLGQATANANFNNDSLIGDTVVRGKTDGTGRLIFSNTSSEAQMIIDNAGNVGIGNSSPTSELHLSGVQTFDEQASTPSAPTVGTQIRTYMKDDKFILVFDDSGTVRYKYLDMTSTGVTWVHTTSAP